MKKKLSILLSMTMFICLITGCAPKKPKICTTVYPVNYLVNKIGGEYVETCSISSNSINQLSKINKDYKKQLESADALFYINGMEPYMEIYMDDIRETDVTLIDLGLSSAIYNFKRYTTTTVNNQEVVVETPYYEGEVFDNIDVFDKDPMLWMDPIAMSSMSATIKDYLVANFPEYKKAFNDNFKALEADLAKLDANYQEIKNSGKKIAFVSILPSFGYWQKSYGIEVYPIVLSKYGALPTEEAILAMEQRISADGVRYIVLENNLSEEMNAIAERLITDLGLVSFEMNNVMTVSEDENIQSDYLTVMYDNLTQLQKMMD